MRRAWTMDLSEHHFAKNPWLPSQLFPARWHTFKLSFQIEQSNTNMTHQFAALLAHDMFARHPCSTVIARTHLPLQDDVRQCALSCAFSFFCSHLFPILPKLPFADWRLCLSLACCPLSFAVGYLSLLVLSSFVPHSLGDPLVVASFFIMVDVYFLPAFVDHCPLATIGRLLRIQDWLVFSFAFFFAFFFKEAKKEKKLKKENKVEAANKVKNETLSQGWRQQLGVYWSNRRRGQAVGERQNAMRTVRKQHRCEQMRTRTLRKQGHAHVVG